MDHISYIENKNMIASAFDSRNYYGIAQYIYGIKDEMDYYSLFDNGLAGYKIIQVPQLTKIYGFEVYAVNFYFVDISHEFNEEYNSKIATMINHFKDQVINLDGYIIIKVPSNNSMLINQLNQTGFNYINAGGTVCYYSKKKINNSFKDDSLVIRMATKQDKMDYWDELIDLGRESFNDYFGQYHISHITRDKAPVIYENWVEQTLNEENENNLVIALMDNKLAGFVTLEENEKTIEIILNAVDKKFRGMKIYEKCINYILAYTISKEKISTISTQFDNYVAQRAWVSNGYKPYHSFYLYHISNITDNTYNN